MIDGNLYVMSDMSPNNRKLFAFLQANLGPINKHGLKIIFKTVTQPNMIACDKRPVTKSPTLIIGTNPRLEGLQAVMSSLEAWSKGSVAPAAARRPGPPPELDYETYQRELLLGSVEKKDGKFITPPDNDVEEDFTREVQRKMQTAMDARKRANSKFGAGSELLDKGAQQAQNPAFNAPQTTKNNNGEPTTTAVIQGLYGNNKDDIDAALLARFYENQETTDI